MSKQLKKLSYEPETITINVVGEATTDSGTLTISQIKVLLENTKNTITYQTSANYSEVLHLAQADYENLTAPKATYTADYYDSSTNVYYKHIIVVSYNTLFNSATWVFVSAPMVSGSSSDLQEKLVSGTNIKTINSNSLLGSGNLAISEFPERSETDATLVQIAGVNSGGSPDVGKVAAGNISSTGATNGQVLTADGSGNVSWGNKQDTLTASSVNDGTIAKAIGFDSSNNLVKGRVGGGGLSGFNGRIYVTEGTNKALVYFANGTTQIFSGSINEDLTNVLWIELYHDNGYSSMYTADYLNVFGVNLSGGGAVTQISDMDDSSKYFVRIYPLSSYFNFALTD